MTKADDLAHDVATTSGGTIRWILQDTEAMAYLATRVVPDTEGATLAAFVECAQIELNLYETEQKRLANLRARKLRHG